MDCKLTLRNLLRWEAGTLSPAEQKSLRMALEQSPRGLCAWRSVGKQAGRLAAGGTPGGIGRPRAGRLSVDLIAGYLDGTLDPDRERQVEGWALRDPDLLSELILHFHHFGSGATETAGEFAPLVPWAVTERLFQLGEVLQADLRGSNPSRVGEPVPRPELASASVQSTLANRPNPAPIQMARAVSTPPLPRPSLGTKRARGLLFGGRQQRILTAATLLAGAATVASIWLAGVGRPTPGRGSQLAQKTEQKAVFAEQTKKESAAPAIDVAPAERRSRPAAPLEGAPVDGAWVLVALDEESRGGTEPTPDTANGSPAPVFGQLASPIGGNIADFKWLVLEGIVALRQPGEAVWFGPRSSAKTPNGLEWQTLPGSWASASLGGLGEIVLDSGTAVEVSTSLAEKAVSLDLTAGKVGLKKLPAGLRLRVRQEDVDWDLTVGEPGSSVAVDWTGSQPRLIVSTGSVRVGEQEVKRAQQLVHLPRLNPAEPNAPPRPAVRTFAEQLVWLNQPSQRALVDGRAQAELLASGNVVAEMNRIGAASGNSRQVLAQHLPAILAPEEELMSVLDAADASGREEAFEWLLGLSPRSAKTRKIWRAIAQKSAAPELASEFFRLAQLHRLAAPITRPDAEFLTAGLNHQRLFIRELSQMLLERFFGDFDQYDAAATDEKKRRAAAALWSRKILSSYQPAADPKR